MLDKLSLDSREVPVAAQCDVLVAGGGVSGAAAALGAARSGADTILVERSGCWAEWRRRA